MIWTGIHKSHPEIARLLEHLMYRLEQDRFLVRQFFFRCWGGNPLWIVQLPEVSARLREYLSEVARKEQGWRESGQNWGISD